MHGDYPGRVRVGCRIREFIQGHFQSPPKYDDDDDIEYRLIEIPPITSCVHPLRKDMEIASSYSFVQGIAAIAQIFFASKELYDARGDQIGRYGYAAFGLTVIPYLWMSFLNLLAAIMRPQYSHQYLLHYGGAKHHECPYHETCEPNDEEKGKNPTVKAPEPDVQEVGARTGTDECAVERPNTAGLDQKLQDKVLGAVGVIYFPPDAIASFSYYNVRCESAVPSPGENKFADGDAPQVLRVSEYNLVMRVLYPVIWLLSMVIPYIIIYVMTGFEAAGSTFVQRFSVVGWLAIGQALSIGLPLVHLFGKRSLYAYLWVVVILLIPVGVFSVVTVSKTILETGVCVEI